MGPGRARLERGITRRRRRIARGPAAPGASPDRHNGRGTTIPATTRMAMSRMTPIVAFRIFASTCKSHFVAQASSTSPKHGRTFACSRWQGDSGLSAYHSWC